MLVHMIDKDALKVARAAKKLSQAELAKRAGVAQQLIGQLERGEVRTTKAIYRIAQVLDVLPQSLDTDIPRDTVSPGSVPLVGIVGAGSEIFSIDDHAKGGGLEEVERPAGAGPSTVALRVRGDSMRPAYKEGDLIYYDRQSNGDLSHLVGHDCVVKLTDGRCFVKELRKSGGRFWLNSFNADPLMDIEIEWAAKVKWVLKV